MRQWDGLDECQSCTMEQVLILALGAIPVKTGIVCPSGGVRPGRALGNHDLDMDDVAGRCCAPSNTAQAIERRCRLVGQTIGRRPKHLFSTLGT